MTQSAVARSPFGRVLLGAVAALGASCSANSGSSSVAGTGGAGGAGLAAGAGAAVASGAAGAGAAVASGGAGGVEAGGGSHGGGGPTTVSCAGNARPAPGGTPLIACGQIGGTCGGCIAENACELFGFQCAPNADCVCMAECVGAAGLGTSQACLATCGLSGSPPGFAELAEVVATMCPDSDECSVPAGFAPPPPMNTGSASSGASLGGGDLPDCSFDTNLPHDPNGAVLQLQSADGGLCVRVERRNDGAGSNANTSFSLIEMRVGPLGAVCVGSGGDGCWHSSHHNFDDWAHASCGGRHYDLNIALSGHGAQPTYELRVFEGGPAAGGACAPTADGVCPIGAPIVLLPAP